MSTEHYSEEMPFLDFDKWLFGTIASVAIGSFLTLIVGFIFPLSASIGGVILWLMTTLFSYWVQVSITRSTLRARMSHQLFWLLVGSAIGWIISLLLVYPLIHLDDLSMWIGFLAGGAIGLSPGIFTGLVYYWFIRPYNDAMYLFVINVIGWCLGMGLSSAIILLLLNIILSNFLPIF
jgi:hypothetical protein